MTASFPNPFTLQNPDGAFPAVLLVEHARDFIPAEMNGLGVAAADIKSHIGWDIGIEGVTRGVSEALGAPAIYCLYSRLIIDVNRPLHSPELVRPESDGIQIPGNAGADAEDIRARVAQIYDPYHAAAEELCAAAQSRGARFVVSMHSCTPQLRGGVFRPWEIGLSTYRSEKTMERLGALLRTEGFNVGLHEPYDTRDLPGASLDVHGAQRGMEDILVEIRQDQIADADGQARWAGIMARALSALARE